MVKLQRHIFWTYALSFFILIFLWIKCIEIWPATKEFPSYVHKTLYVDRHFSDDEFIMIAWAANRWSETTNHIIDYDVVRLPITDHTEVADRNNSIVINKVSSDFPDVIAIDYYNGHSTLGYYTAQYSLPMIAMVNERIIMDEDFEQIIMHELGHSVGLDHMEGADGIGTLMYPSIDAASDFITQSDLISFCKLYKCDPNRLQHEEKPLHL